MRKIALLTLAPLFMLTGPALAQSPSPSTQSPPTNQTQNNNPAQNNKHTNKETQANEKSPQVIRQQVQKNLQQAGFTDIQIMPSSFLVRAKDHDGNPVMMVINPDSVTAITEIPGKENQTTGNGQ